MKKKILIVDDNEDLARLLEKLVENLGYKPILATNGKQAVDIAAASSPDLIVLDIVLPEMNGLEAARLIRQNPDTSSIPILAISAKTSHQDRLACLQSGCDDYLAKPFMLSQLASSIERLLK